MSGPARGEQARDAVEGLIRAHTDVLEPLCAGPQALAPRDIFMAATRVVMRVVVVSLAEARGLLRPALEHVRDGSQLHAALGRVSGGLFEPGVQALAVFENPSRRLDDALGLLRALKFDPDDPTELVGMLYAGLLDYELGRERGQLVREQPGQWTLAPWAGTRKGAGTFYTPAALARPTTARTLRPLVYADTGEVLTPAAILSLKVCDPAMGSGAFLLAALAYLSQALRESVERHGWPPELAEQREHAELSRLLIQRCLYGVDLDPLAVELARASLWLELGDPSVSLDALGDRLRCGNALVGCWRERCRHYPILAWAREGGDRTHREFVHHRRELRGADGSIEARGDPWTHAIKTRRAAVEDELAAMLREDEPAALVAEPTRETFDLWCALWFWPGATLEHAPGPRAFVGPRSDAAAREVAQLRARHRFFHWELEFPEVFDAGGFDCVLSNPPWDTLQGVSKEFFSRHDPAYRSYPKQRALEVQRALFRVSAQLERAWVRHQHDFGAMSNWVARVADPWARRLVRGREDELLRERWRTLRASTGTGTGERARPFALQGQGKVQTYRLFTELAHALLADAGILGTIVPSGLYTDRGSAPLRRLLLDAYEWRWLFGFDNAEAIFAAVDRRFKFAVIIARKGEPGEALEAAFMRTRPSEWARERPATLRYPRALVRELSPVSSKILELDSERDLELLRKLYAAGEPLRERARYSQGDLNMTSDSPMFISARAAAERGDAPTPYGLWRSQDGELLCPLLQGSMVAHFDSNGGCGERPASPKYLVSARALRERGLDCIDHERAIQFVFRDVARATDSRSVIGAPVHAAVCGNTLGKLDCGSSAAALELATAMNSLVVDWIARVRLGGAHLNYYVIEELVVPATLSASAFARELVMGLAFVGLRSAGVWRAHGQRERGWRRRWALTEHERVRRIAMLDALVAHAFGLTAGELGWITAGCDLPEPGPRRGLSSRGFWRVDKHRPPELRQPVLAQVAFFELERGGLDAFVGQHGGEGWMLPETLRLADYGLGHDARAREGQLVAAAFGPRFVDGQRDGDAAREWTDCLRHAEQLDALLS